MEDSSVDVKALRARFNNNNTTSDTSSSRDSADSPKSPRPGFGRIQALPPVTAHNELAQHRLSPTVPGPGLVRFPRAKEPMAATSSPMPPRHGFPQRLPPPHPAVRGSIQPPRGEVMPSRHQRPPGPIVAQALSPSWAPVALRQPPRQKSVGDVTPLRKPLPPEGPLPLKPKRPPNVNLEPFLRFNRRGPALPAPRKHDDSPISTGRKLSLPAVIGLPKPPLRSNKPSTLPHQISCMDIEDHQDTYDDIGFEQNESWSDNSSHCLDADDDDDDDVYESIDEDQVEENRVKAEKKNKKEAKRQREQEKKDQLERQKREKELKKNFQLQGEVEVLHTARVRHDWQGGGKLDLNVRQGESVEILRVNNNPGGKWLARSLSGNYGYISNTCVDIDYEAVKRKVLQSRKIETSALPPPPPDPPFMLNVESNHRDSMLEDDDDYDDIQQINEDFPPPPPELISRIDPKVMKDLRKKFKFEGPVKVLHTMMVDPNCVIKKLGGKDLHITHGEVLDVIQLTNSKKALCCNQQGKYGYVSRSFLLQMEGDIYDDVDYTGDIYDNDTP